MSNSTCFLDELGGPAKKGRAPKLDAPSDYFNTLFDGVKEWYDYLAANAALKGYGEPEKDLADIELQVMYAGQSQSFTIPYVQGKGQHAMAISVYKRDQGQKVYEVTAYNA